MSMDGKPSRVLIWGADAGDAERLERQSRELGLEVAARRVDRRREFLQALESFAPSVVMFLCKHDDLDRLTALRLIWERKPDVPAVLVVQEAGGGFAVDVVKAGAIACLSGEGPGRLPLAMQDALAQAEAMQSRQAAERAFRAGESKLLALMEQTGDWIWESDPEGVLTYASPQVLKMLGYDPGEVLGRRLFDLMAPPGARRFAAAFRELGRKRSAFSLLEAVCLHRSGQEVVVQMSGVPLLAADGGLEGYCGIDRAVSRSQAEEQEIVARARTDTLTGLANRAVFLERLRHEFSRARRGRRSFAVLLLDLDHFKDVNDMLGHAGGDKLLAQVAVRLNKIVREIDLLARLGGDEFAILGSDAQDPSGAGALAEKLIRSLALPFSLEGNQVRITASIGISLYQPALDSPEAMLTQADRALYQAKSEGRGRYSFHSRTLDDEIRSRNALGEALRTAIERDRLEVHYQPQIAAADRKIVALEALVRWRHPRRGLLLPADFIGIAEAQGTMQALGRWVLDRVCRDISQWRSAGLSPPVVGYNLAAAQIRSASDFESELVGALTRWGISPESLELELGEAALLDSAARHGAEIERLGRLGVRLAIDGFGGGHFSLGDLRRYRFARLKIARAIVAEAGNDAGKAAVLRAILAVAAALGIEAVAVGVETRPALELLTAAGCKLAQGNLFCPPVPADRMAGLLREGRLMPGRRGGLSIVGGEMAE